ncbi:MAG: HIT family protein [Candidatus Woesearchaeota archaeon]|nr:MAG: HIT family protein [Candidatus Woesearchaeota archaeon]
MNPEEREKVVEEIKKKAIQDCIFCKILRGEIPAKKVFESEDVLSFLDINPVNPGHTLVIPKKHYLFITQIPDGELSALMSVVKKIAGVVLDATKAEGITISQLNGKAAGQIVPHVHFHIIPRYENDKMDNHWPTQKLDDEQFNNIQRKIIELVKKLYEPKENTEEKVEDEDEEYEFKPRLP